MPGQEKQTQNLVSVNLVLALVALVVTGLFAFEVSRHSIENLTATRLVSIRDQRRDVVLSYFTERLNDLRMFSRSPAAQSVLSEYTELHRRGELQADGLRWADGYYADFLDQVIRINGYYDLFLVGRDGTLLFSDRHPELRGRNLLQGGTSFAPRLTEAIRRSMQGEAAFSDLAPDPTEENSFLSFISSPVTDQNGQVQGALVVVLNDQQISAVMQNPTGLGESGEALLIGPDGLLRSNSRFETEVTTLRRKVTTDDAILGLAGFSGTGQFVDFRGVEVLAAYAPLRLLGQEWVIVAKIDAAEAFAPLVTVRNFTLSGTALILILFGVSAGMTGRSLIRVQRRLQSAYADLQAFHGEQAAQQEELMMRHAELETQRQIIEDQRDQLEETLARVRASEDSNARLAAILENTSDFVAMTDADGRLIYLNRAARSLYGAGPDETLEGTFDGRILTPEGRRYLWKIAVPAALSNGSWEGDFTLLDPAGVPVPTSVVLIAHRSPDGQGTYISAVARDIRERKRAEEELLRLANYDALTGLFNRRRFHEEMHSQLAHARRHQLPGAVLFIDLDQFKYVNDSLGHHAGDELLRSISDLFRQTVREIDVVARLGGDEFAMLVYPAETEQVEALAERLRTALNRHSVVVDGQPIRSTASIGVVTFPGAGESAAELLAQADLAMYQAKDGGRNRVTTFTHSDEWRAVTQLKLQWEGRIHHALEQDRFVLHLQPIRDLQTGSVAQYEALLRMIGEDGRLIMPAEFLETAERFGLILAIDRWVVCRAIQILSEAEAEGRPISLSVNLSGKCFDDEHLLELIQDELKRTGVDPGALILEITETAAVGDISRARQFIEVLKHLGCTIAIDDFGSGFSSILYLLELPIDYLKIDGSFVRNLLKSSSDQHLVRAMVSLAHGMNKRTIAEFVENPETARLLLEYGVDLIQGYQVGRPAPVRGVEQPSVLRDGTLG